MRYTMLLATPGLSSFKLLTGRTVLAYLPVGDIMKVHFAIYPCIYMQPHIILNDLKCVEVLKQSPSLVSVYGQPFHCSTHIH
jgi:hypothetical protein